MLLHYYVFNKTIMIREKTRVAFCKAVPVDEDTAKRAMLLITPAVVPTSPVKVIRNEEENKLFVKCSE